MTIILIAFGKCHECLSLTQLDSAQPGLTWLSIAIESILALNLKNHFFVQILFEFLAKIMIQYSKAFMFLLNRDLFFKILQPTSNTYKSIAAESKIEALKVDCRIKIWVGCHWPTIHSTKEQWIIILVYWVDSNLHKMYLYAAWTSQLANLAQVGSSNRKRHFLKLRINKINKENNPLFFTAMIQSRIHFQLQLICRYMIWP